MSIELFLYTAQNSCPLDASSFSCKLLKLYNREMDSNTVGEQVMLTRGNRHSITAYFPYTKNSGFVSNIYTITDGDQAIQFRRSGSSKAEPFLTSGVYDVSAGQ